jgi:hypothetical protein
MQIKNIMTWLAHWIAIDMQDGRDAIQEPFSENTNKHHCHAA